MIRRRVVAALGLSQMIYWGTTYYLIGGFGTAIAADTGWSPAWVHGGFALALLTMGLVSPLVGRLIDRHGGRPVMSAGSLLAAAGCALLAAAHSLPVYYAAWLLLGLSMRCTLYDAGFAALARLGGAEARRAMTHITLPGGLASTVFWPLGQFMASHLGWRGAVAGYALIALAGLLLHRQIPAGRHDATAAGTGAPRAPLAQGPDERLAAGLLYALIVTLTNFLNSGMSAHMIGILAGLGLATTTAVWTAALRGIGQSTARLGEALFGRRLHPLDLNLSATVLLPLCFTAALWAGEQPALAATFALGYGMGNGLLTITRGTVPLVMFDLNTYGALVGRLLVPGFIVSAAAPLIYAGVIARWGPSGALVLSIAVATATVAAALLLRTRFAAARRTTGPAAGGI